MKIKKVVITGAASMIWTALIKQRDNIKVIALVRSNSSKLNRLPESNLVTIVNCGLEYMEDIDPQEISIDNHDVFFILLGIIQTSRIVRGS